VNDFKVIIGKRGSGKTDAIIRLAAKEFLYIVCSSGEVRRIVDRAKSMDLDIPFPLSYSEFMSGQFCGRGIKGFVVDNVDLLVIGMARGVPVRAISVTIDED
jgi:hypothetical protein